MPIGPGSRLGPYEVTALIGEGGMGKVWRAHHPGLKRDDALKVLPDAFASDPDRLARFQREAQVLASLNHPNIAHVYGLERTDGVQALVMELVEGPTLADRIAQGPIPVDEALPIAKQIAEALEAAHEQGIIHRDLKPANIKLRPDGTVKVLDFGLAAKAVEPASSGRIDATASPTITSPAMMTGVGVLLGTAAYMSPEQARGKAVDKRSDIWAFGCVLYEMLTGRRAFGGDDVADSLGAVIHKEPDWAALPPVLSPDVRAVLQRCLQKDLKQRVRDAGDVRLLLEGTFDAPLGTRHAGTTVGAVANARWMLAGVAAVVVSAGAVGLTVWAMRQTPPPVVRLTAGHPGPEVVGGNSPDVAIAADGRRIAYMTTGGGQRRLHVRSLDQLASAQLIGGELVGAFMSPDGEWVGFAEGLTLKKIAISGGPAITICNLAGFLNGASWAPDDTIIFSYGTQGQGLWRVSAAGGDPEPLTTPDQQKRDRHVRPDILPGAHAVVFDSVPASGPEDAQILTLNLQTGEQKILIRGGTNPRYAASGHLVYAVGGALRAVGFDPNRLEVIGNSVPIAENVKINSGGSASFALAQNGTLVYIQDVVQSPQRTLVWVDRQGREEPINIPVRGYVYPRISPDGTRVALDIRDTAQDGDIWVWDLARQTLSRLTFGPWYNRTPVWSPDGRRLVFLSNRSGPTTNLFWQAADGTGAVEQLTDRARQHVPSSISPDGTRLVFRAGAGPSLDIEMLSLGGEREITPLIRTPFIEQNGEVSPDGRWLVYESNESGQFEIYVRPFPDIDRGRWQISTTGGTRPMWERNGGELFYLAPTGALMAVPVEGAASFTAGSPVRLFEGPYFEVLRTLDTSQIVARTYDISPDGRRFLMIKDATPEGAAASLPQIVVVQNWLEELKRLVPTN